MTDMTAFERQLSDEIAGLMGPVRPVDDAAIFTAITATQSPKWRFQSMFSATKFVVAGAIVALFGGFLLSGVLTQPSDEEPFPPAAASASSSPEADTSEQSVRSDLLPGVDLVTEEVEPGVYRVLSDGVRDLSRELGAHPWFDRTGGSLALDAFGSDISIAPDGSVWYFGPDGSYRIGDASRAISVQSEPVNPRSIEWATDGTAWGTTHQLVRFADGSWTADEDFPRNTSVGAVGAAPDGVVWAASDNGKKGRVSRLDADGWTHIDAVPRVQIGDLKPGHDDDVWLMGGQERPTLVHFDGSGWNVEEPTVVPPDHRATLIEMAADGSLWAYFGAGETGPGHLGRYQDGEWTVFSPEDGVPEAGGFLSGMGAPGLMEAAPDGRLWLTPEGDWQRTSNDCDGVTSFDGQTWTGFLSGECIYGLDAAEDGTLWLLAGRPERDGDRPGDSHTYVITPEAVAATE